MSIFFLGDSFGDGKHKKPYTLIELKKAEQTALSLRDKRRLSIKKKKEKWSSEAAERRLEVRQNLKQNEQNKFELRIIEERQKLIELERKKQIEIERMKLKKIKELKEIEEKKQHQLKLEQDELNRIHRIKNEMKENSKKESGKYNTKAKESGKRMEIAYMESTCRFLISIPPLL